MKTIQNLLRLFGYAGGIIDSITEEQLRVMLSRNPEVTAIDHSTLRPILAAVSQPGAAHALEFDQPGNTQSQERPFVCFVFRRIHLLDVDAIAGSGKDLLDGLADAGLIPGDREKQIGYEALQQKVGRRKEEGTFIFIATGKKAARLIAAKAAYRNALLTTLTQ